jgi:hypothetical protein
MSAPLKSEHSLSLLFTIEAIETNEENVKKKHTRRHDE